MVNTLSPTMAVGRLVLSPGGVVRPKPAHREKTMRRAAPARDGQDDDGSSKADLLDHLGGIDGYLLKWVGWDGDGGLVKNLAEQRFFSSPRVVEAKLGEPER